MTNHIKLRCRTHTEDFIKYYGDDLEIVAKRKSEIYIGNRIAGRYFLQYLESDTIIYIDRGNIISNRGNEEYCRLSGKTYPLKFPGDSINFKDGSIACMLKKEDLLEMLENTFFLPDQQKIYDFTKQKILLFEWNLL